MPGRPCCGCSHEVTEQKRLVERAAELSKEWRNLPPAQTRSVLRALIARIDLQATNIDIHLASTRLPDLLRGSSLDLSAASECAKDADRLTLSVPARFQRVGKGAKMIINGIGPNRNEAKPDPSLIKLIVKAHMLHGNLMSENLVSTAA